MTLSEAIRLGAMLKPQAFSQLHRDGSCALQAAADALGFPPSYAAVDDDRPGQDVPIVPYYALERAFPFLNERAGCPMRDCLPQYFEGEPITLLCVVWHLNDWHEWTREQIAEWLEMTNVEERGALTEAHEKV